MNDIKAISVTVDATIEPKRVIDSNRREKLKELFEVKEAIKRDDIFVVGNKVKGTFTDDHYQVVGESIEDICNKVNKIEKILDIGTDDNIKLIRIEFEVLNESEQINLNTRQKIFAKVIGKDIDNVRQFEVLENIENKLSAFVNYQSNAEGMTISVIFLINNIDIINEVLIDVNKFVINKINM